MDTPDDDIQDPSVATFQPQLSDRWRLRWPAFAVVTLFAGLFLLLNYFPLRGTDLWLHVNMGERIVRDGKLPTSDPFSPLSQGMQYLDFAWLSQLIFAETYQVGGPHGLSALFTATMLSAYLFIGWAVYRRSGTALIVLMSMALAILTGWSRIATIRPENFAFLAFCALLVTLVDERVEPRSDEHDSSPEILPPSWIQWLIIPTIMLLWANLHGSFPMGLIALGCFALGKVVARALETGKITSIFSDSTCQRWILLVQVGTLITLLNPAGIDLWLHTFWFASNENLKTILEWQPLVLLGVGGREYAFSVAVLLVVLRWSRKSMNCTEVLLLTCFGILPVFGVRMLTWYSAVLPIVLAPHLLDCLTRFLERWTSEGATTPRADTDASPPAGVVAWAFSLLSLLVIWAAFAFSPWSHPVLGTPLRAPEQLLDAESTPLALTRYLQENPPRGQVFHPQIWGDWFVRTIPGDFQPFATSNIHVLPKQVWQDYLRITVFGPGWQRLLDRYNVKTWIADKKLQPRIKSILRGSDVWQLEYEDDQAVVYVRKPQ